MVAVDKPDIGFIVDRRQRFVQRHLRLNVTQQDDGFGLQAFDSANHRNQGAMRVTEEKDLRADQGNGRRGLNHGVSPYRQRSAALGLRCAARTRQEACNGAVGAAPGRGHRTCSK